MSIGLKHSCMIALIVASIVVPSLVGPLARPCETQIQDGKRLRQIKMEPVRIHIDPIVFKALNQPEVDLRPDIAAMGITIRDQGDRGTCSIFAMTFLLPTLHHRFER